MELIERLGLGPESTAVLITADGLGNCHSANVAIASAQQAGEVTTAGIMIPCPWARSAAQEHRGSPVGVSLTLNAELSAYRWGPLTHAPSLLDGNGGFPSDPHDLWEHADLGEVRRELRAQIERAILWGFDVSHLSSHLDALPRRAEFFDVALELSIDFAVPLRLGDEDAEAVAGFPFRDLAAGAGVLTVDAVLRPGATPDPPDDIVRSLQKGVTEIVLSPAVASEELRAADPSWSRRIAHDSLLRGEATLRSAAVRNGIAVVSWLDVRRAQRAA